MQSVIANHDGTKTIVALQEGNLITGTSQDCTAIAENAKAMHANGQFGSSEMRFAARIPKVYIDKYLNDHNIGLQEFCRSQTHQKRLLNDPSLSDFRIWKGRL